MPSPVKEKVKWWTDKIKEFDEQIAFLNGRKKEVNKIIEEKKKQIEEWKAHIKKLEGGDK